MQDSISKLRRYSKHIILLSKSRRNRRLISKNGTENVVSIRNIPFKNLRKMNDTFHTMINLRWRYLVFGTVIFHFALWFVFAVFWYLACLAHGDFDKDPPKHLCVTGGKDFVNIFLASVEAQTTIGFGDRAIDEECPESIFLLIMQLVIGTGASGILMSLIYTKLTRPEKMSKPGVGFSKYATLNMLEDGRRMCLEFRVWDLNRDHIIGTQFSAHLISHKRFNEGETSKNYVSELKLEHHGFLIFPLTIRHIIDENSPLFHMVEDYPHSFKHKRYEISLTLKGASEILGTYTHSITSYLPNEIKLQHQFVPVVRYDKAMDKYVIDEQNLDTVVAISNKYSIFNN